MHGASRRSFLGIAALGLLVPFHRSVVVGAHAAEPSLRVYKSPYCGCCHVWARHMRAAGFDVRETNMEDLEPIKARLGVPAELRSCHTAVVEGYVVEGHVPASDVSRLLSERPAATGLAVPGMPIGSPGMEQGQHKEPYAVVLFSQTERNIFARH